MFHRLFVLDHQLLGPLLLVCCVYFSSLFLSIIIWKLYMVGQLLICSSLLLLQLEQRMYWSSKLLKNILWLYLIQELVVISLLRSCLRCWAQVPHLFLGSPFQNCLLTLLYIQFDWLDFWIIKTFLQVCRGSWIWWTRWAILLSAPSYPTTLKFLAPTNYHLLCFIFFFCYFRI